MVPSLASFSDDFGLVGEEDEVSDKYVTAPDGFEPSPSQADEWHNPRKGMCGAKDNTCGARATKKSVAAGSPLCVGHGRSEAGSK